MSDSVAAAPARKRKSIFKKLGIAAGILFALLLVGYFVVTSGAFFKGFIAPRIGAAIEADFTVADAAISPFSQVTLRGVKIQSPGKEPLLTADEIHARYGLWDIIGGHYRIDEVRVTKPIVHVEMDADGKSNLPKTGDKKDKTSQPKSNAKLDVVLDKLSLTDGEVSVTQTAKDGSKTVSEIKGLNITVAGVKNGGSAKLDVAAALKMLSTAKDKQGELTADLKLGYQIELDDALLPKTAKGDATVTVGNATGAFKDAAQLTTVLTTELSPTELKQLAVRFNRGGTAFGSITASGPLDIAKQEGRVHLEVAGIGNEVLSIVGGRYGFYFNNTKVSAAYDVEVKNAGKAINTSGKLKADDFSVTHEKETTPVMNFLVNYDVALDLVKSNAVLRSFVFTGLQSGKPLLKAALSKETAINWGKGAEGLDESQLELNVTNLRLADWRPFLGTNIVGGAVNGKILVTVIGAGKKVLLDLDSQVAGLKGDFGGNHVQDTDIAVKVKGTAEDLDAVTLSDFSVQLVQAKKTVATVAGSGSAKASNGDADLQLTVDAALPQVAALANRPDLAISSGTFGFKGKVTRKSISAPGAKTPAYDQTVAGSVNLDNLTGNFASNRFDRFVMRADVDVEVKNQVANVRKADGSLQQAGQAGGSFDLGGKYDLDKKSGEFEVKLVNLNQNALKSFVAAALGDNQLTSVSINADARVKADGKGKSTVTGDLQVANLLITDPQGELPKVPMTASVNLDATYTDKGQAELRKLTGSIKQGELNGGSFEVSGSYDSASGKAKGKLKLDDLNQNALRPFLAVPLGKRTLTSVSISADGDVSYDPKGASAVKAKFTVAKLLVKDPEGKLPTTPLSVDLNLDGSLNQDVLDFKQAQLTLAPTDRAKNQLTLSGRLDRSHTNAITGTLKLVAESLDVTPYYDLFVGDEKTEMAKAEKTPPPGSADKEPEAMKLPFKDFTFSAEVGKFYLREVAVQNFKTTLKIDGGRVTVDPLGFALNGAPFSLRAAVDVGVPGYKYDLATKADRLPVGPLINSFAPTLKGRVDGNLISDIAIQGEGTTGPNLKRALAGKLGLTLTNAVVRLNDPNDPKPKKSVLMQLMSTIFMFVAPAVKLDSNDFLKPPIEFVDAGIQIKDGTIQVQQLDVRSSAFHAHAAGNLIMDDVLTNSVIRKIPLDIDLGRSLAIKAKLASASTPTNQAYVKLPSFVKVRGTVGKPDVDLNEKVIIALVIEGAGGSIGGAATDLIKTPGNIIEGAAGLLGGKKSKDTNAAGTNAPPAKGGLLDFLNKKK